MKQYLAVLFGAMAMLLAGCAASDPIYYEELSEAETKSLVAQARELALRSKAMPEHMREVFVELEPASVRVNYDTSKHGKMAIRWEIYEPSSGPRLTQKDVNPYWIMVYAIGDFSDPEWKLSHAAMGDYMPQNAGKPKAGSKSPSKKAKEDTLPGYAAPPVRQKR